jgi:hypothetical protein
MTFRQLLHKGPSTAVTFGITYDTSVGNGIATDGLANLPLRPTVARRFYVNSSTGSDSNTITQAQVAATPVATLAKAMTFITQGAGDQILVARGTTYSAVLPNMSGYDGFSALYPTVVQCYDPADPTNEAKMGRASGDRPTFTYSTDFIGLAGGGTAPKYLAWRGLDIVPTNTTDKEIYLGAFSAGLLDYILIENCIFRYIQVTVNLAGQVDGSGFPATTPHFIFRGNTITGMWSAASTIQAIYLSTVNYTLEDNVVYHAGWKLGASREDLQSAGGLNGGATTQDHSCYAQYSSYGIARRNFIVDGSTDGGSLRGNNIFTANVGLDNPIQLAHGGGHDYFVERPDGVMLEASYNAFIGDADIYSGSLRGFGYYSSNGKQGSANHHNIIAQARNPAINYFALSTTIDEATDSWMNHYRNVIWNWNVGGSNTNRSEAVNASPGTVHATYSNNIWDDATSGTNTNKGSVTVPNAYTNDQLIQAMGYTTGADYAARKLAMMTYLVEHPEAHPARNALTLAQAGYGITPLMQDLVASINLVRGQPARGPIVGTLDGSVLTCISLPSGLTINSETRQWIWDGSGSGITSGTIPTTETPATGPARTTNLAYAIDVAATLTSPTAASTGTTTATLGITTNNGAGSLYWILTTASATPSAVEVNAGYYDANNAAAKAGSVAVSSTGAKTINVTGLTTATTYFAYLIQNVAGTRSSVSSLGSFTTS